MIEGNLLLRDWGTSELRKSVAMTEGRRDRTQKGKLKVNIWNSYTNVTLYSPSCSLCVRSRAGQPVHRIYRLHTFDLC